MDEQMEETGEYKFADEKKNYQTVQDWFTNNLNTYETYLNNSRPTNFQVSNTSINENIEAGSTVLLYCK